jgi:hypothetical protein
MAQLLGAGGAGCRLAFLLSFTAEAAPLCSSSEQAYLRRPNSHHELLGKHEVRQHNLRLCGFRVTFHPTQLLSLQETI